MKNCGASDNSEKINLKNMTTASTAKGISKKEKKNTTERKHACGITISPDIPKIKPLVTMAPRKTQYDSREVEKSPFRFDLGLTKRKGALDQKSILGQLEAEALLVGLPFFPSQAWRKYNEEG